MTQDLGLINAVAIEDYAKAVSKEDSSLTQAIFEYTHEHSQGAHMLSGPLVARLLQILIQLSNANIILDMGTFTGYSALSIAEALPEQGEVYTCDKDPEILKIAQRFFDQSPNKNKIKVIEADGLEFLQSTDIIFDLIFLDAEKKNLKNYYEAALKKLKPKGILIIDDMLWRGEVLSPSKERAKAIDELNQYIKNDPRVINVLLPIRHGLQLIIIK